MQQANKKKRECHNKKKNPVTEHGFRKREKPQSPFYSTQEKQWVIVVEEAECSPYSSFSLSSPLDLLIGSWSLGDNGTESFILSLPCVRAWCRGFQARNTNIPAPNPELVWLYNSVAVLKHVILDAVVLTWPVLLPRLRIPTQCCNTLGTCICTGSRSLHCWDLTWKCIWLFLTWGWGKVIAKSSNVVVYIDIQIRIWDSCLNPWVYLQQLFPALRIVLPTIGCNQRHSLRQQSENLVLLVSRSTANSCWPTWCSAGGWAKISAFSTDLEIVLTVGICGCK